MPPKKPSTTRPQDQKSLNRFLGLPLEQVPGKLNQFGFAPVASTAASARSPAPELDDEKPAMAPKQPIGMDVDSDSDTEQVKTGELQDAARCSRRVRLTLSISRSQCPRVRSALAR